MFNKEVEWIKCSHHLPSEEDIKKNNSDIFWVYLLDMYGNFEVVSLNYNTYMKCWECLPGEHVTHWAYFTTPEAPND